MVLPRINDVSEDFEGSQASCVQPSALRAQFPPTLWDAEAEMTNASEEWSRRCDPRLTVMSGHNVGEVIPILSEELVIGRAPECDAVVSGTELRAGVTARSRARTVSSSWRTSARRTVRTSTL